jgi:hypothetical protein
LLKVTGLKELTVKSQSFGQNQKIPRKFTCDGEDVNPSLKIEHVPPEAKSLVLIVDDPDAPGGTWDHWVVWNIVPTERVEENTVPGTQGLNSFGKQSYGGPCPPSGTHRYFFKVYALDTELKLPSSSRKKDVEKAMQNQMLAKGELVGLYSRE